MGWRIFWKVNLTADREGGAGVWETLDNQLE